MAQAVSAGALGLLGAHGRLWTRPTWLEKARGPGGPWCQGHTFPDQEEALLVIYSTAQLLNAPRAPSHPAPSLHLGQDGKLISQGSGTHPARCLA